MKIFLLIMTITTGEPASYEILRFQTEELCEQRLLVTEAMEPTKRYQCVTENSLKTQLQIYLLDAGFSD